MPLGPLHLAAGQYTVDVTTSIVNQNWDHYVEDAISFEVLFSNPAGLPFNFKQSYGYGAVALPSASSTLIERMETERLHNEPREELKVLAASLGHRHN